jgi:DNA primase
MVSCPFHKGGQENRPSCGVKIYEDDKSSAGTVHCFTCGVTTSMSGMVQEILGDLYNEDEVESMFGFRTLSAQMSLVRQKKELFTINKPKGTPESILREYRHYHRYLQYRGIKEEVAHLYDIGFDSFNNHITFPIRDIYRNCIGVGRRSITEKRYIYPYGMIKPLYGLYELPKKIRYLWVVEGPFNLWSLRGWGKQGVAMLGTGTGFQYKQLLDVPCEGYVLALDGDDAGRNGTQKLGQFLMSNKKRVFVADVPEGEDINSISEEYFRQMQIFTYIEWHNLMKKLKKI